MFKSGDSYTVPVLQIGNIDFLREGWSEEAGVAGDRIWCITNNPKSGIIRVQVTKVKRFPLRTVQELRKISEMVNWALTDGYYMDVHQVHGYLQNKYMCLMLKGSHCHSFTRTETDMGVDYIMTYLNASSNGTCTSVAQHVTNLAGCDLDPWQMRASARTWYQRLLDDIEFKLNQLEKEAA
jgi:hypothetical protein